MLTATPELVAELGALLTPDDGQLRLSVDFATLTIQAYLDQGEPLERIPALLRMRARREVAEGEDFLVGWVMDHCALLVERSMEVSACQTR